MASQNEPYDVIVVGAGIGGLSCAGELVSKGVRTLLVCETAEVARNIRPIVVNGNMGYPQFPMFNIGWGGSWWAGLARDLNVPVSFLFCPNLEYTVRGTGVVHKIPNCTSASALADVVEKLFPFPVDRPRFERVLKQALAIPWQDLVKMGNIPISQWLDEAGADEALQALLLFALANMCETTTESVRDTWSAFGAWGLFRGILCAESPLTVVNPCPREGLALPLADAIVANGGEIWKGRKVTKVLIENGRAVGVILKDGTEVRAKAVALATGTKRIPALLDPVPAEVAEAVEVERAMDGEDVTVYTVLSEPVCTLESITCVANPDLSNAAILFPMHCIPGNHIEPGKQYLAAQALYQPEEFAAVGGQDGAVKQLNDLSEELFPGFAKATEAVAIQSHPHHWWTPFLFAGRLPARAPGTDGLWYAGDGSTPNEGFGLEGACSAGILRAREIAESLQ